MRASDKPAGEETPVELGQYDGRKFYYVENKRRFVYANNRAGNTIFDLKSATGVHPNIYRKLLEKLRPDNHFELVSSVTCVPTANLDNLKSTRVEVEADYRQKDEKSKQEIILLNEKIQMLGETKNKLEARVHTLVGEKRKIEAFAGERQKELHQKIQEVAKLERAKNANQAMIKRLRAEGDGWRGRYEKQDKLFREALRSQRHELAKKDEEIRRGKAQYQELLAQTTQELLAQQEEEKEEDRTSPRPAEVETFLDGLEERRPWGRADPPPRDFCMLSHFLASPYLRTNTSRAARLTLEEAQISQEKIDEIVEMFEQRTAVKDRVRYYRRFFTSLRIACNHTMHFSPSRWGP